MRARIFIFLLLLYVFSGCSSLKKLTVNEYLVNENIIRTDKKALTEELTPIIKQKPNKKLLNLVVPGVKIGKLVNIKRKQLLAVRFNLFIYNLGNTGNRDSRFKSWLRNTPGEPPVILDTALTKRSALQIRQYLNHKGYFNATVKDSTVLSKRKEVDVYYLVDTKQPYVVDSVRLICEDKEVLKLVKADSAASLIKKKQIYDESALQQEVERVTNLLKNHGYYRFGKEYVHFEVDSALNDHKVNLYEYIDRPNENSANADVSDHKVYKINKVFVYTDFDTHNNDSIPRDTIPYNSCIFLHMGKKTNFNPPVLSQGIFIRPGDTYAQNNVEDTYQRMGQLGVFKFVNIKFGETDSSSSEGKLNTYVQLSPLPKQSFTIETELTHNSGIGSGLGNLGIGGSTNYRNKNLFKGAELLEFKVKGGLEAQTSTLKTDETNSKTLFLFNTVEVGPELNLTFHKFIVPFRIKHIGKNSNPATTITTAYDYQLRPIYQRSITNLSISYAWKASRYRKNIFTLLEVNGVKINKSDSLTTILNRINDRFLLNSYNSHLTTATRYTFVYNTQDLNFKRRVAVFTVSVEQAGIMLNGFNKLANTLTSETGNYLLFGLRYAQYVKTEIDLRLYHNITQFNTLAYRIAGGLGVAYGNSDVLPFEKSFFAGGANDIRAWPFRRLGPGSYSTDIPLDQTGDIKLVGNFEYRFNLLKLSSALRLQGAAFVDAGNIWTLRADASRPGADFDKTRFYKEMAVAGGTGARLNFGFFIIRVDYALKLRDPALEENDRWLLNRLQPGKGVVSLGIGHPF